MKKRFCRLTKAIIARIDDKIVEILYSNRTTSENNRIHTHPCPLHSKLECLLFSIGCSIEQRHNIAWRGCGGKAIFPHFEVSKT